jgi:hypothetical protein
MTRRSPKQLTEITIRSLYPELTDEECREAEENLDRYIDLILRMYERIRNDPKEYARFKALTAANRSVHLGPPKVEGQDSIPPV